MSSDMKNELFTQPIINIGCLGAVSEGKSSLVKETTGIITPTHSKERERNITINQGFGNMKIWQHNDNYITTDSTASWRHFISNALTCSNRFTDHYWNAEF